MFSRTLKLGFIAASIIFVSGCGTTLFSPRNENPVIHDYAFSLIEQRKSDVFATTASRRLAIINSKGEVCAEPSPDVGEAFASSVAHELKLALSAKQQTGQEGNIDIDNQYSRAIATQIAPLLYRTQGLQFYRDSLYNLCIAKINGIIDQAQYLKKMDEILKFTNERISEELPIMKEIVKEFYVNARAGEAKIPEGNDRSSPPATSPGNKTDDKNK